MDTEKRFRTKTGFCHILSDKIVLTRDGIVGNLAKVTVGNSISRILIIYGLVTLGLIYFAFDNFKKQDNFMAVLLLLFAVYLFYGIVASLNNSATPMIDRKSIQQIKFKKGITGLTRTRFEVIFTEENGKSKKRLIMLPGSLTGGQTETDIAYKIMTEEKLL
ncbi:MAG: phosphoribosylaminoimidazolesuccinocarboxamide synthase [Bacteroidota bacterium]|nr:MAG: phosphoribosylaminoimidazolesuccinocarboxamide synthase [Bacteroidota bacterium]